MKTRKILLVVFILSTICISNIFAATRTASWNGYPYPNPIDAGALLWAQLNFEVPIDTYGELVKVKLYVYNIYGQEAESNWQYWGPYYSPGTFYITIPSYFASGLCYIRPEVIFYTWNPYIYQWIEVENITLSAKKFTILN